jgi:Spy/CpxP family protein refolding chaperone
MKFLMNLILIAALLTTFTLPGFSCEECYKSGHGHMIAAHCGYKGNCCDKLGKELNLTDKQQAKLDKMKKECMELHKKLGTEIAELSKKKCSLMSGDKMDKDAASKVIDKLAQLKASLQKNCLDCMEKVHALLTPEQLKKMKELKAKCNTQHNAHAKDCSKDCHTAHAKACSKDCHTAHAKACGQVQKKGC